MTLLLLLRSGATGELPINRPVITMVPAVWVGVSTTGPLPLVGNAHAAVTVSSAGVGKSDVTLTAPWIGAASHIAAPPMLAGRARGG